MSHKTGDKHAEGIKTVRVSVAPLFVGCAGSMEGGRP